MLPSNHRRWCTELMKLKPFENYIGSDFCINYVGIRADEERIGYISHKPNIRAEFPFREDGIDYAGVQRILADSGLGLPPYTDWGRTRSGCFFCFYQQKIEWVRLKQRYPQLFEEAKAYEKPNSINGNIFYWCEEPLAELEKPARMAAIEDNWRKTQERLRLRRVKRSLAETLGGLEVEHAVRTGCLTGVDWAATGNSLVFAPQSLPTPVDSDCDVIAQGVFRLEFCYLLKTAPSSSSTSQLSNTADSDYSNVSAIVVAIAVMDDNGRNLLTAAQFQQLSLALLDSVDGQYPISAWSTALNTPGFASELPQQAVQGIQIYQRIFNVP